MLGGEQMPDDRGPPIARSFGVFHATEAPGGGVLSHLEEVIAFQSRAAEIESVAVLGPEVNAAPLRAAGGTGVRVVSFDHHRGSPASLLRLAASARRVIRTTRPDILSVHSTFAGVVVRLAALTVRPRPKVVYLPHSWAFARSGRMRGPIATAERLLARCTDRIVCVSGAEQRDAIAIGIPAEKCHVIENGIRLLRQDAPPQRADAVGNRRLRVLFVGRFDHQKGFDVFLDIMARLGDAAEGLAVGDYIIGRADARVLVPDNVTLLGWRGRDEVQELYGNADLLLMPSRWEGLPIAALEAMRARLPLFATRVGGLEDVILDGTTGRFIDIDNPEAAAALIVATSRVELAAFAERGYRHFLERFTAERMNRGIVALYRNLLDGKPEAAARALSPQMSPEP
jgi:glycosyltransferase involved in cell wall biosynthesis